MNPVIRAKLDLIIAVTAFGTIGIFVRYIALPSSIIALVRGAVGAAFLWLLLRWKKTPFQREALRPHLKLLVLSGVIMSFNWITLFEAYNYTTVATATLCYYMAPVFVTLASPFLFHERLTARKLLCILHRPVRHGVCFRRSPIRSPAGRVRPRVSFLPSVPPYSMPGTSPSTKSLTAFPPMSGPWCSWPWPPS